MKKLILSSIALIVAALAVMAFTYPSGKTMNQQQEKVVKTFPENVAKVLETSCFDCHSNTSSNVKALDKIDFSIWGTLSDAKKVGKMQDMKDMLTQGKMPPSKYLAKYPDRALETEQKNLILKWVEEESARLMGE